MASDPPTPGLSSKILGFSANGWGGKSLLANDFPVLSNSGNKTAISDSASSLSEGSS